MSSRSLKHRLWPFDNIKHLFLIGNAVHVLLHSILFKINFGIVYELLRWYLHQVKIILTHKLLQASNEIWYGTPLGYVGSLELYEFLWFILELPFFDDEGKLVIKGWLLRLFFDTGDLIHHDGLIVLRVDKVVHHVVWVVHGQLLSSLLERFLALVFLRDVAALGILRVATGIGSVDVSDVFFALGLDRIEVFDVHGG